MKNNKGITLIALVITIIVMLILVGVTISMAVNGGLFNYAGNAVGDTRNALNDEQLLTNTDIIDYYVNRKPAVTILKAYSTDLLNHEGVLGENAKYESGYNIAVIPKGFKVSDVAEEQTIEGGLVIEDAEGNQFVWVPVKDGEFKRTEWYDNKPTGDKNLEEVLNNSSEEDLKEEIAIFFGFNSIDELMAYTGCSNDEELLQLFEATVGIKADSIIDAYKIIFEASQLSEYYFEYDATGDYGNMLASVNKYGGFYIGRYEAGSNDNRYETKEDETVLVKKGAYPYNYVIWGCAEAGNTYGGEWIDSYDSTNYGHGAVYLSLHMYDNQDVGVQSTLCYAVQWDAALRFVRDEHNVTDSTQWGNYEGHEFAFTGEYSPFFGGPWENNETTKPENERWILTTGASEENKAKNIYDLAGNVSEWTMEMWCKGSSEEYVCRGSQSASNRGGYSQTECYNFLGFRPTLYIK